MSAPWPNCRRCDLDSGIERPASFLAAHSLDRGVTIEWMLVCDGHASNWNEDAEWEAPVYRIDDGENHEPSPQTFLRLFFGRQQVNNFVVEDQKPDGMLRIFDKASATPSRVVGYIEPSTNVGKWKLWYIAKPTVAREYPSRDAAIAAAETTRSVPA